MRWVIIISIGCLLMQGCASFREKKSEKYYLSHEREIKAILKNYSTLYKIKPFNIGFADRDMKTVGMDVMTDTVRYALHNRYDSKDFIQKALSFGYDSSSLVQLYKEMYAIKCLWLGVDDFYHEGRKQQLAYLSFKSANSGNPFLDRKYYTLVFFDPEFLRGDNRIFISQTGLKHIQNNVYFGIMERFR